MIFRASLDFLWTEKKISNKILSYDIRKKTPKLNKFEKKNKIS